MLNKDYTAKLLDLVDVIITKVENFSESMYTLSCHGSSTDARPVEHSLTVYTTIGCR